MEAIIPTNNGATSDCPLWPECGAAFPSDYAAKREFYYGDSRRDRLGAIYRSSNGFLKCELFSLGGEGWESLRYWIIVTEAQLKKN